MPNRKSSHGGVTRGKTVLVRLRDGSLFVDVFYDTMKDKIIFINRTIFRSEMQMMSIYKGDVVRVVEVAESRPTLSRVERKKISDKKKRESGRWR